MAKNNKIIKALTQVANIEFEHELDEMSNDPTVTPLSPSRKYRGMIAEGEHTDFRNKTNKKVYAKGSGTRKPNYKE